MGRPHNLTGGTLDQSVSTRTPRTTPLRSRPRKPGQSPERPGAFFATVSAGGGAVGAADGTAAGLLVVLSAVLPPGPAATGSVAGSDGAGAGAAGVGAGA